MLLPRKPSLALIILVFSFLNLFSFATELIQEHLIPGRAFQWLDLALNTAGTTAGLTLILLARGIQCSVQKCFPASTEAYLGDQSGTRVPHSKTIEL